MFYLLCNISNMGYLVELVAATAKLMDAVILKAQLGERAETKIRVETERLAFQLWQLRVAVAVMVIALAGACLPIGIDACLVVISYQRHIARRHVVERVGLALRHEGVAEGSRIADRLLGYDVDGSADGRCSEEGRASTTHHLHAVYHVGRNLLQAINAVQGRKHRARIDQYLRVVAIETVYAHLREATVLTVVLRAHARLEVEPLRQTCALCDVKQLSADHVDQVWRQPAFRLVSVGRNNHLVEVHVAWRETEVELLACVMLNVYGLALRGIAQIFCLNDKRSFRQVFQKIVACLVGCCGYGCSFQLHKDVRKMLARLGIFHMAINVGVCVLCFLRIIVHGRSNTPVVVLYIVFVVNIGRMGRK